MEDVDLALFGDGWHFDFFDVPPFSLYFLQIEQSVGGGDH